MGISRRHFHAAVLTGVAGGLSTAFPMKGRGADERRPAIQQFPSIERLRASPPEVWKLVDLINEFRRKNSLAEIPLSPKLTAVAFLHAKDLAEKSPQKTYGTLHSWSMDPRWSGGAYRSDDMNTWHIMWDKPKEITGYAGHGFEICAAQVKDLAQALGAWKDSRLHHDVILNRGVWSDPRWQWQAIGAVFHKGYACGWFGNRQDA